MKRAHLAAAALLVAACSSGPTTVGLRLSEPSAIVAYRGVTAGSDVVRPLLAVASRRSDDLRLIDPNSDLPIFGPGVIFPLSIPTSPRPQLLASASLGDGKADVLVAVSAGSATVQVIETWETGRVEFDVKLDDPLLPVPLAQGAEILSVLGVPASRDASGNVVNARVLVAATGAQLAVVEFKRAADDKAVELASTPTVNSITFDAIDMALLPPPDDLPNERRVFLASREKVGTTAGGTDIFGVGELNGASDLKLPLTIKPLDARAPTVAVATGRVVERKVDTTSDPCSPYTFVGAPVPRVYAALDESGCGPGKRINCGIATLDPDAPPDPLKGQLANDLGTAAAPAVPLGGVAVENQGYRAPMPVVGVPIHIAIGYAPASGSSRLTSGLVAPSGCPTTSDIPLMRLQPSAGLIDTSAVAMVTSSDGHVYWYDLARSAPVNDTSAVVGGTRAGVTSASTAPVTAGTWALGLWNDVSGTLDTASVTVDPTLLPVAIETWPGFTEGATWKLIWQGPLPSLQSRAGVIATIGGVTFATFENLITTPITPTNPTGTSWAVVAPVADPALGVHAGDTLQLPSLGCETTITQVLAAAPALPGFAPFNSGAVQLAGVPPCLPAPPEGVPAPATLTVRASGLVLVNDHSGYMGRPQIALQPLAVGSIDGPFTLQWQDESTLEGSTDPATLEKLALARKARRIFYPIDSPCPVPGAAAGSLGALPVGCYGYPVLKDPLSPGPALRLRPGLTFIAAAGVTSGTPAIARDTTLTFATSAGLVVTSRRPAVGGALPANLAVVDRTDTTKGFSGHDNEGVRFYVPYADDQVIEFSADGSAAGVASLR